MPPKMPPDVAYLMSQADRRLGGWLAAKLAVQGCSVPQWRVLRCLADGQGHPMSEIAEFAMLPGPTLTKLLDRMVAANLVYRRADDHDRRRVLAYLSERGMSLYRQLAGVVDEGQAALLTALGDHGELARLLSRLSSILGEPAPAVPELPSGGALENSAAAPSPARPAEPA
jgi:DNA-binding MarR family transcriptional regulator